MMPIRVLLAEDHETVRHGLRLLLESEDDIDVVGEAPTGRLAVERAISLQPQVVILDISMPEVNGLAAAEAIKRARPEVAIVALTRHEDEAFVTHLMALGASGYVLKQSASSELLSAIRAAARGEKYLDRAMRGGLARLAVAQTESRRTPPITHRERSVLRMMAIGHSNKEIAAALEISVKTVEVHKANAMRKLDLRGRIDVVRYAIVNGWLQEPSDRPPTR
jgi:DNA-binding NarL/FixJ family response regulator